MSKYDLSKMSVTNESFSAFPVRRAKSKYDDLFRKVAQDMRLKCPPGTSARMAAGLKKWLIQQGHANPIVKSREHCGDGMGGVWWLGEAEAKPAKIKTTLAKAPWLSR